MGGEGGVRRTLVVVAHLLTLYARFWIVKGVKRLRESGRWEMGTEEDKVGTNETQPFNIVKKANQQARLEERKVVYRR